jgi:DNA-binding protein YbaB
MAMAGSQPGSYDLSGLGNNLRSLATELQQASDQMRQAVESATAGEYTASSPDKWVEVTVNGRCRVSAMRLHPYLLRQDAEAVDQVVTATVNDALGQARAARQRALLDGLPPRMRASVQAAAADAGRNGGER